MSCGRPHETDCSDVLERVYEYLDGEMGPQDCEKVRQHLEECGPCLREYDRDQLLKLLIRRSCGCEPAPIQLRTQILAKITTVSISRRD